MIVLDRSDDSIPGEFEEMMKELHADFEKSNGRPGIGMPGLPLLGLPLLLSLIGAKQVG